MRTGTVSYKVDDLRKSIIIPIGFVGENDFTRVIFDAEEIYKNYPAAQVSMKVQPQKGGIYPATVTRDGNTVIWQVKEADVANRGGGELQLTFTDGETKIKTYIAKTDVKRSLAGNGPAPDPVQDWVDNAEEVLDDLAAMDNIAKTAEAGDIGKALSPKTVENGVVTEWQYVEPGAGTEDYTDLENKPKIGGVELSGNKSLHDLGIAAESAIPDVSGKANLSVVAPAFDQATANDAGSLVTYTDGVVYVLPEGHTAGTTWANTQKTATNIAEQQRLLLNDIQGLDEELNGEKVYSINLFNSADPDILDNKYIDGSTGQEESYNGMMETGFIACVPTDTFTFYNSDGYLSGYKHIAYYNAQKQFVDGSTGRQLPTITIPSGNIAYFRIALNKSSNRDLMIVKNDIEIHNYVPYGYTMSGGMTDSVYPWKGKNVVLFGDSIMYNDGHNGLHGYPYYLAALGFSTITNKGENGACIAYHSERSSYKDICTSVDEVTFTGYDLVVIEGGINDYLASSASPIGAIVNSTNASDFDKTTFIGALQYVITTIFNAKATIKIVLFTPLKKTSWYNSNSQGKTLIDYVSAMKQVAEYYSIPVLDYFAMSGLNRKNLSAFTSDGLHPNNDGYKFICENKLPAFINSMLTGAGASEKIDKPTAPSSGDFLVFNGTTWVAQSLSTWQGGNY